MVCGRELRQENPYKPEVPVRMVQSETDEVVVKLKRWSCYLLSLLRIHSHGCEICNPRRKRRGEDMRKRLAELQ